MSRPSSRSIPSSFVIFGILLSLCHSHGEQTPTAVWTSFIILSILHLFFNYKAVSSVVSDKINRLLFLSATLSPHLLPRFRLEHLTTQFDLNPAQPLPNPKELAAREPIFDLSYFSSKKRVELGVRPSTIPPFAFTDIDALPPKRYQIAFPEVEYLIPDVKEPRSVLFTFSGVPVFLLFVESENSIKVALNSYPSSFPTNLIESLALFIAQMLASVQGTTLSTPPPPFFIVSLRLLPFHPSSILLPSKCSPAPFFSLFEFFSIILLRANIYPNYHPDSYSARFHHSVLQRVLR